MNIQRLDSEVPVKMYRSAERLTVAAPFPGLEPQDIRANITEDGELYIEGRLRGALKGINEVLRDEWNPGPYRCRVPLNTPVDGTMANITYENGVVVVAMPVSSQLRPAELTLERVSPTEGRRIGHAGRPVRPMSAEQHYQLKALVEKQAGAALASAPRAPR